MSGMKIQITPNDPRNSCFAGLWCQWSFLYLPTTNYPFATLIMRSMLSEIPLCDANKSK